MGRVLAYDQLNINSFATTVAALPAGSTLLQARLACTTSFSSTNSTPTFQFAPPNTILGISWVAHGTAVPIITTANWKDSEWYIAGMGELDMYDDQVTYANEAVPKQVFLQHTYQSHIELDVPLFEAGAFDLGISINWLGAGFWLNNVEWLNYQFVAYFD